MHKNGEFSGLQEDYGKDGQLDLRQIYKNGGIILIEHYHDNGQLSVRWKCEKGTYRSSELVPKKPLSGLVEIYGDDGKLMEKYTQDGPPPFPFHIGF